MDLAILIWIQQHLVNPLLSNFFVFYTNLGEGGILWIAIILFLLSKKKTRTLGILCALSLLTEFIINDGILKNLIGRARPFTQYPIKLLIAPPNSYSMPSGHAASSFAMAMVFFFRKEKTTGLMLFLASLMAFSRLYLFVHYPSDVLAGMLLGTLVSFCFVTAQRKYTFLKESRDSDSLPI